MFNPGFRRFHGSPFVLSVKSVKSVVNSVFIHLPPMKFLVAQIGARRGYAVLAILEKAGMLERFYTNITGDIDLGKFFSAAAALPFLGKPARRLAGRRLPSNIRAKTTTFPCLTLMHILRRAFITHNPVASFRSAMRFSNALGRAMARQGFGNATHMYSMLGECGP